MPGPDCETLPSHPMFVEEQVEDFDQCVADGREWEEPFLVVAWQEPIG
ncbi:MAG: hypothetical protein N2C14_22395 [Planctomycetales bacterium]